MICFGGGGWKGDRKLNFKFHTVPETLYFPIFSFAHRSFTVRSLCVHRSQFCALRSAPFAIIVHKAFTLRSHCVQYTLSNRSLTVQV